MQLDGMKIHPRVFILNDASAKFHDLWHKLSKQMNRQTYQQGYLVINQVDRFWIECSLRKISVEDACLEWSNTDYSAFALPSATEQAGHNLATLASELGLTYAEIFNILMDVRRGELKYHIRGERHPNDPDKPGGLA